MIRRLTVKRFKSLLDLTIEDARVLKQEGT